MSIFRAEHDKNNPYLCVSQRTIRDKSLSLEARGFLMVLLSKPDDWRYRPSQLARECGVSKATIYRLLKQLIRGRYVVRGDMCRRSGDGRFQGGSIYFVYEEKLDAEPAPADRDSDVRLNGETIPF